MNFLKFLLTTIFIVTLSACGNNPHPEDILKLYSEYGGLEGCKLISAEKVEIDNITPGSDENRKIIDFKVHLKYKNTKEMHSIVEDYHAKIKSPKSFDDIFWIEQGAIAKISAAWETGCYGKIDRVIPIVFRSTPTNNDGYYSDHFLVKQKWSVVKSSKGWILDEK